MEKTTTTISDIKSIKQLMDEVDSLKEKSLFLDDYSENYGSKSLLIESKENKVTSNVKIVSRLLSVDFNTVIDMCYDLDFAKLILKKKGKEIYPF